MLKKQGIILHKGDVVLFNTGWLELVGKDNSQFMEVKPSIYMEVAQCLVDQGIVAFGGDTCASEVYPDSQDSEEFPVNQFLMNQHGIYNLELIDSRSLVRNQIWEFLFLLVHPLYVSYTQVNINLIAVYMNAIITLIPRLSSKRKCEFVLALFSVPIMARS
ncbi:cyclase family protein [Clostridium botulinum]|uniref:cyclase family protein n=1 Tax=Clostridium botulinum TaxID=1491 RepID=UPI0018D2FE13|nr:cyclase family protein [Clostridium botulinum]